MAVAFGISPLALTPFGFGTSAEGPVPPTRRILAPFLDPYSKQLTINADGELEGMSVNFQRVLVTCMTLVGSSSVDPQLGIALPKVINQAFIEDAKTAVRQGLQYMIDDGSIFLDEVQVELRENGQPAIQITFRDRQRGGLTEKATIDV